MSDKPTQITPAPMCQSCQSKLVRRAKYGRDDTWQACIIVAQLAIFQAASCTPSVHKRIDGDITRIGELGCLACRLPSRFEAIIKAAATHDLGKVKQLGGNWVAGAGNGLSIRKVEVKGTTEE